MPHGDHHSCGHHHGGGASPGQAGGHHHHAPPDRFTTAFALGIALNAGFVAAETGFGLAAHSMALVADAAHNLGDVLGLGLAWGAAILSRRRPSRRHTYGFGRSSILAALVNAAALLVSIGAIATGAIQLLLHPQPVGSRTVMAVAAIGIAVNGLTALLFARGRHGDLNLRGAFLHMLTDAVVSAGVVMAGLAIRLTGWQAIDPLVSLAIAAALLAAGWSLLRESVRLSMDAVPEAVDRDAVEAHLRALPGVTDLHDLHIWPLSTTEIALTAHLVRPGAQADDGFLAALCAQMRTAFGIGHATFQLEQGDAAHPCALEHAHRV